jgi:tol-pal system protein YbgF
MNKRVLFFSLGFLITAAPMAQAQLFGPSDEEKAHEAGQDQQLSTLAAQNQQLAGRVQVLEDKNIALTQTLASATNTNEELRHQLDLLSQKMDQQQKDFVYRLCMVSAQQLGAGGDALNCAAAGTSGNFAPPQLPPASGSMAAGTPLPPVEGAQPMGSGPAPMGEMAMGAPTPLPRPPGVLGTLPGSAGSAPPPAIRTNSSQFDAAMGMLSKAQYDEAKAGFRAYADANPDDSELSPQAIYWVGNINYIQHDYTGAITAFAEQIKKYPKSTRGPDSMLKLGQSLLAMGRTQEGCTTLGAIKSKFPDAPAATLTLATGTRKASRC